MHLPKPHKLISVNDLNTCVQSVVTFELFALKNREQVIMFVHIRKQLQNSNFAVKYQPLTSKDLIKAYSDFSIYYIYNKQNYNQQE